MVWLKIYYVIRIIFIVVDVILFIALVVFFIKSWWLRPGFSSPVFKRAKKREVPKKDERIRKQWETILKKAGLAPPQSFQLGIIEADKFVDNILKKMGLPGEHMADRLEKLGTHELRTLDKVWRVHRIRNELVHNPDFNISSVDIKELLGAYESFLKELEIL